MSNEKKEEEKKKWQIDRVQTLIESYVKKFESERARNRSWTDIVENDLTASRSAYLSAVSVAATVILALYSANVWKELMLPLLAVDIGIGMIVYAIFNSRKKRTRHLVLTMDAAYFLAADKLTDLHSLFIQITANIDEIDEERIRFYWAYLAFASLAVRVYLIDIFDDMSKSKLFLTIRSRLSKSLKLQRALVKKAQEVHGDPRSPWNYYDVNYNSDLEKLNPYIEEFFNYDEEAGRAIEIIEEEEEALKEEKQEKEYKDKKKQ
jgi:hypothetical protein